MKCTTRRKNLPKIFFGNSAISNSTTSKSDNLLNIKQETLLSSVEEYESCVAWKQYRNPQKNNLRQVSNRDKRNYSDRSPYSQYSKAMYKRNPVDQVKFFKGYLPQILLGPLLNTWTHLLFN